MTTAPPEDQRRLLEVQALDTRLQQLAHKRTTLPSIARIAELDAQISDLSTSLVASRTAVSDLKRELTKAEGDVEQVRTRAARDQTRLDSGQVGAKDAQALVGELASLARRQEVLEEVELGVMERLEAHEDALAKLDAANDELLAAKAAVVVERDAELAQIDAEVATVTAARAQAVEGLDTGLVTLYDRLRAQLGGLGAAVLSGRRCEGCRLELNPSDVEIIKAKSPDQVARCEECSRILVRLDA
ncbi:zinc ribbon domain-containing protein [Oerskovia enterophila]|uniref:Zinc ribbon domain protein n=1 Tax=Oerskovia enterophila TaxID=43678 RepID=A0A163R9I5_9CELL|nr:C4-type zinc ribbon domain-containing protein [Oerskovia enterophila]KZM34981.1 putative zinc ribbon domain protein [Oerskovia enterophila]OCI30899.1 putative zinc ribbon domain protein [Oerskovia enterophila]